MNIEGFHNDAWEGHFIGQISDQMMAILRQNYLINNEIK